MHDYKQQDYKQHNHTQHGHKQHGHNQYEHDQHEYNQQGYIQQAEYPKQGYLPPRKDIYILGIETTCDETSLALVKDGVDVINEITISQAKKHAKYGGVVPELAARNHIINLQKLSKPFFEQIKQYPIHYVAVASKIGLPPAVKVGESYALGLAKALNKPLIEVNHVLAHLWGVWVDETVYPKPNFPFLGVTISGGHTQLAKFTSFRDFKIIAETLDDSIGEAFDKVARLLDWGYPGGPIIEKNAKQGDEFAYDLPVPLKDHDVNDLSLSFAGLKTAVLNLYTKIKAKHGDELYLEYLKYDIASSFQRTAFEHLIDRIIKALRQYKLSSIVFGGGVAANNRLYDLLWQRLQQEKINAYIYAPRPKYCMDNASLIAGFAINLI